MSTILEDGAKQRMCKQHTYCCQAMQYFCSLESAIAETLEILPRIILYRKPIYVGKSYETLVAVKNMGLHHRRLTYSTDSNDVVIKISTNQTKSSLCIDMEKMFELTIILKPKSKHDLYRRRHIFVHAEHPNIVLTLPIIFIHKNSSPISIPTEITFPSNCIGNTSFYEIVLYNDSTEKVPFTIKCNYPPLTIIAPKRCIPKQEYITILLKLAVVSCGEVRESMKLKFGIEFYDLPFVCNPIQWSLYLGNIHLQFGPQGFNHSKSKSFRICNESSKHAIRFHLKFSSADEFCSEQGSLGKECNTPPSGIGVLIPAVTPCRKAASAGILNCIVDKYPYHHFECEPKCGTLRPNTSTMVVVTYKPIMHCHFFPSQLPPYPIFINLFVVAQDELKSEIKQVQVCGSILGTEIEIKPRVVNFQTVYCGEEHCASIEVVNLDCVTGCHVDFCDYKDHDDANVIIRPQFGLYLQSSASGLFHLQFFAKKEGKLFVKLKFKVKNGDYFYSAVKGDFQQVRLRCFPDIIEMGTLPVCVPQKRYVLLMNPLAVPITLQCTVVDDGSETPLVLDIIDTDQHLPITVNDPIKQIQKCLEEEIEEPSLDDVTIHILEKDGDSDSELGLKLIHGTGTSLLSFRSAVDETSSCSTDFQENALDLIPKIAPNMLHHLMKIKIFNKPDVEGRVVDEVMKDLLKTPYFCGIDKYKNYCSMDWNLLPNDPMEVYCNNEIIYLLPNTGKTIVVIIIPNVLGKRQKYLELRVCPFMPPPSDDEHPNLRQMMDSTHMKSKLWIEYNCSVPRVVWDNVIDMQDALYSGELYDFEMIFENCSKVGGFFYYEIIPDNANGYMQFLNGRWKYFVGPNAVVTVPCAVEFKKTGFIELSGLIKFVGLSVGFPFHIKSEILPPKIEFSPRNIEKKIVVLHNVIVYIYIDNTTPTTTWFRIELKDESKLLVHPLGAQLAPTGQGTYLTLDIFYQDPGIYRNILYIYMQYEVVEKIPITLIVEGMPIFFEPDILSTSITMGYVLCNVKDDNPSFTKSIRVINKGERSYRIIITKTKCSARQVCSISPNLTRVVVKPHCFTINPMSEEEFTISAYASEEYFMHNEFRVDIIDTTDPTRIQTNRLILSADFIYPQLTWNRHDITMEYHRTHKFKEHDQWEILKLTNVADNFIEVVYLKVSGPFLLKELFEHRCAKELAFSMCGLETKELFVVLDKDYIRNRLNASYEGRLTCCAQNKTQKYVNLKVNMFIPTLALQNKDVLVFAKDIAGATYIQLHNPGSVVAIYKWKKLQEEWHYVDQIDDPQQVAEIILSDVISQLELKSFDNDDDSELKMTKQYCFKHVFNDPIDIKGIIYKIIDELDLLQRRYQLVRDKPTPPTSSQIEEEEESQQVSHIENMIKTNIIQDSTQNVEQQIEEAMQMLSEHQHDQAMIKISKIQTLLNSRTIYFNRKFRLNSSECTNDSIIEIPTSSDTCVFHTLDHVFGHLKLEDSYTISEPSSDKCDREKSIFFYEKCGVLEANQTEMCTLHIPEIRKGFEVSAIFCLDVIGGKSQQFRITYANLDSAIRLSNYNVYLGLKPWYETFKAKIKVDNITSYELNLKHNNEMSKTLDRLPKVATGFVKILNDKSFRLPALKSTFLKTEGVLGFTDEFIREISISVNDGTDIPLRLRGNGVMPILTVANHTVPYVERDMFEIQEEYQILQKIYYFETFKAITVIDDDMEPTNEENEIKKVFSDMMELSVSASLQNSDSESSMRSSRSTARREREMRFFRILQSYVLVNNNEELPNASVLNQLVETERFLNLLRSNEEIGSLLKLVYQKGLDVKTAINLNHFTTQPLPFQLRPILWDLGRLVFDQYHQFTLTLEFSGPGKLIASARTVTKIPGVLIDFQIAENFADKDCTFYRANTRVPDKYEKTYRNMSERLLDAEIDPKVKHAHSFDISIRAEHQRDVSVKERKWLMDHYDSLNKSVYLDRKQHFTYCKVLSKCKHNLAGAKINVCLLIKPRRGFFSHDQRLEDYLYIDLHMGPTLALLLRGRIVDPALEQHESVSSSGPSLK